MKHAWFVREHNEEQIDYTARAILMPFQKVVEMLQSFDYEHLSPTDKRRFIRRMADRFCVPELQAFKRIKEVSILKENGYKNGV